MLCPRTKKWIKKGKCAGDKMPLYFDVDGLEEGQEYNFRVKAINDEGESDPLEGDKPIIAKNPFGEYMSSFLGYRDLPSFITHIFISTGQMQRELCWVALIFI